MQDTLGTLLDHPEIREVGSENIDIESSLRQRLIELEVVNRLSIALRMGKNLDYLLQILLDETLITIKSNSGVIFLYDEDSNTLKAVATRGWGNDLANISMEPTSGIAGYVFTSRKPYYSQEIKTDERLLNQTLSQLPQGWSGGWFPIQAEGVPIGIVMVTLVYPRQFYEDEIRLLTIITQLAGNAVNRIRLYDQLQFSNDELQKEVFRRRTIQDLLANEKELLSMTLMSIGDGVIMTDEDGMIVFLNLAAEKMTGYAESESVDQPLNLVLKIIDPNTNQFVENVIRLLLELDDAQRRNIYYKSPMLVTKSGERRLVSGIISSLRPGEGKPSGYVIVIRDITEIKQMEAQSALSRQMEAIGQLAAGIAHEINTPIQYIGDNLRFLERAFIHYTEALDYYRNFLIDHVDRTLCARELEELEQVISQKKIPHYQQEIPAAIREALDGSERVRKIVLAMREFSHPSKRDKKYADINHGIETTVTISRNEWKYYADLEMDLDSTIPAVYCQIDEINQVILNIIVNAAQAIQEKVTKDTEQKGKISIKTVQQGDFVMISIADTGAGIPETITDRIFDPFFTTKGVGKGTGQGLSIAYRIIMKEHHGKIYVDSNVGKGTTFTIELPIEPYEVIKNEDTARAVC